MSMSPIPKPAKAKSPIQKAIDNLLLQHLQQPAVIVHPSDAAEVAALIEQSKKNPIVVGAKPVVVEPTGGPLMKAYKDSLLSAERVQSYLNMSTLEEQLEASLWELATGMEPATPEAVREHSPHMQGSDVRTKRIFSDRAVHVLCRCRMVLRFLRCVYVGHTGQCEEEVPVVEAGHALCVFHRASGRPLSEGSRFYRCDFIGPTGAQCSQLAVTESADGKRWCSQEGHSA